MDWRTNGVPWWAYAIPAVEFTGFAVATGSGVIAGCAVVHWLMAVAVYEEVPE